MQLKRTTVNPNSKNRLFILIHYSPLVLCHMGIQLEVRARLRRVLTRVADVARAALTERSGSSTKGRTPNIRYFVAKLSIVAIYTFFERLSQGFEQKSSCFRRAFNESHPAFEELSTKAILLSYSSQRKTS